NQSNNAANCMGSNRNAKTAKRGRRMSDKLSVKVSASADGKFVIVDITDKSPAQIRFPADAIAPLVAGLLGAASACAHKTKSGATPFAIETDQSQRVFVQANGVALS